MPTLAVETAMIKLRTVMVKALSIKTAFIIPIMAEKRAIHMLSMSIETITIIECAISMYALEIETFLFLYVMNRVSTNCAKGHLNADYKSNH